PVQPAPSSLVEKGREDEEWKVHGGRADGRRDNTRAEGRLGLARRHALREQSHRKARGATRQQEEGPRSPGGAVQEERPPARDLLRSARRHLRHPAAIAAQGASGDHSKTESEAQNDSAVATNPCSKKRLIGAHLRHFRALEF